MRPAESMSMLVGFFSIGECAHNVTSSPAGTVKMSSGTTLGGDACGASAAMATVVSAERTASNEAFMVTSERIGRDVGVDERLLAFLARLRIAVFHAEHAGVTLRADVPEEVPVVHLAGARFLAAGI